ncbi:MAG: calcium-binding protein [Alphaproteobacteria bacterium]|nr:calcium-binding protein [Alphaproteobacteria bacterium]
MAIIDGTEDDDVLVGDSLGTAEADTISGLGGADELFGLGGDDVLDGGAGNDALDGGEGADELRGGLGDDTYVLNDGNDTVIEGADEGTDTVLSAVDYTLPDNVENGGAIASAPLTITGNALDNTIQVSENALAGATLLGLDGNDALRGGAGDDRLEGGNGNDLLIGDPGDDLMIGGTGDDIYAVDSLGDVVVEQPGEGNDTIAALISLTLPENVENLLLFEGVVTAMGNALANFMIGNDENNMLSGMGGSDIISGAGGSDILAGNEGNDIVLGGDGNDRLGGQAGNDALDGGEGEDMVDYTFAPAGVTVDLALGVALDGEGGTDTLISIEHVRSGNGNDSITGDAGANEIVTYGGNDIIDGGAGADRMYGGLGDDTYYVDDAADITSDAGGIDTVVSAISLSLAPRPTIENLALQGSATSGFGNALANSSTGTAATNVLAGAGGNDILIGGGGGDTLSGGSGADIFRYLALGDSLGGAVGRDTILDFSEAEGDVIDLSALDANQALAGEQAFTFIGTAPFTDAGQLRYEISGPHLIVQASTDVDATAEFSLRLSNLGALSAAAFNL